MIDESVPSPPNPEEPPLAPYDPPAPAPQAAAWQRALRVVTRETPRSSALSRNGGLTKRPGGTHSRASWRSHKRVLD
jgi:hypothetical protein